MHTFHFIRSTAAALKHSRLPERYHGGILNERTPSLIKKGNISWNKPPFVQSGEQVDSWRSVASKADGEERDCRRGRRYQGVMHTFMQRKKKHCAKLYLKSERDRFHLGLNSVLRKCSWLQVFTWGGFSEGDMWSALTTMLLTSWLFIYEQFLQKNDLNCAETAGNSLWQKA